ncbi:MAG: Holliday junction resolvase RecU [Lachnospiraceae bacterium]|nr:Holliday junction resolvase RecU [Lachnospiraceae bacterium]
MGTLKSRGLRGSILEEMINNTNEYLQEEGLALIQKIPTPITPVQMDEHRHITLAYFDKKSTVDYIGVVQGIPVCFDAKECAFDRFALQNIHEHQVRFMSDFEKQGGVSFFLIYFSEKELYYYLPFRNFFPFWDRMQQGGRKSFLFSELDEKYVIEGPCTNRIPYLVSLQKDLDNRDDE